MTDDSGAEGVSAHIVFIYWNPYIAERSFGNKRGRTDLGRLTAAYTSPTSPSRTIARSIDVSLGERREIITSMQSEAKQKPGSSYCCRPRCNFVSKVWPTIFIYTMSSFLFFFSCKCTAHWSVADSNGAQEPPPPPPSLTLFDYFVVSRCVSVCFKMRLR